MIETANECAITFHYKLKLTYHYQCTESCRCLAYIVESGLKTIPVTLCSASNLRCHIRVPVFQMQGWYITKVSIEESYNRLESRLLAHPDSRESCWNPSSWFKQTLTCETSWVRGLDIVSLTSPAAAWNSYRNALGINELTSFYFGMKQTNNWSSLNFHMLMCFTAFYREILRTHYMSTSYLLYIYLHV